MWNTSVPSVNMNMTDGVTSPAALSQRAHTEPQNASFRDGCVTVLFSQMEFLPWDNPDNIVSAEVETLVGRIKNNLLVFLFLIGGPANVINMVVFCKQGLRDRVNVCLFALAFADEMYLLAEIMHYGEQMYLQFTTQDRFGPAMTVLTNHNVLVLTGFCYVSPVLSTIIAVERCLCVFYPLRFQTLLRTRTMVAIISVTYTLVLGLVFIVVFRYRIGCVYDPELGIAMETGVDGEFYRAHKGIEVVVVTTVTILTIMKLRQAVTWRSGIASSLSPRELALTKMLVGNSILFIACISPIALNRFSWLFFPEVNSGRRQQNFFVTGLWVNEMCACANSTANFFVYYVMGSRYRETFWALFGRKLKEGKISNENINSETI
ncbi:uncharacterized protein LOC143284332 [Babylonia areolata]|uniref:uncharacterized protein LOC143284332 n=1 Tax=Babylonia areolata TaxID=304850 RepID=UPI003FD4AE0F